MRIGTRTERGNFVGFLVRGCNVLSVVRLQPRRFSSSESDSPEFSDTRNQDDDENRTSSVESVRERILDSSLEYVHDLGWSTSALSEAAKKEGLPGVAHGLFQRGGVEILFHFEKKCSARMMEELYAQSPLGPSMKEGYGCSDAGRLRQ